MDKVKILNILTNIERGAADDLAIRLIKNNKNSKILYSIYITSFSFSPIELNNLSKIQKFNNVDQIIFCDKFKKNGVIRFVFNYFRLFFFIKQNKFKLVEVSSVNDSILIFLLSFFSDNIILIGLHKSFIFENFDFRDKLFAVIAKTFIKVYPKKIKFYAISDFVKSSFSKALGVDTDIFVIPNSIDEVFLLNRMNFEAKLLKFKEHHIRLLYVGRISREKGFFDLINIFLKLNEKQSYFILTIVGSVDFLNQSDFKLYSEIIENIKSNVKLKENLILEGQVYNVIEFYSKSDILIHPTHSEGFGLSIIEALSQGLPIVTTNVDALPELLSDYPKQLLVSVGNIDQFIEGIDNLVSSKEFYCNVVNIGIIISKKYAEENRLMSFNRLYSKLLTI